MKRRLLFLLSIMSTLILFGCFHSKDNDNNETAALALLALQNPNATVKFVNAVTSYCDYGLHIEKNNQVIGNELQNGASKSLPGGTYDLEAHCDADTNKNITKTGVIFEAGKSYEVHAEQQGSSYVLEIHAQ